MNRNTQGPGKTGGTTSTPLHSTRSLEPWRPRKLWRRGGGLRAASEAESRLTPTPSPVIRLHGSGGGLFTCHPIGLTHSRSSVNRRDKERKRRGKEGVSGVWRKGRKKGREQDFSFLNISILLKNLDSK